MGKILGSAKINDKGGFIIPKKVREKKGIKPGDNLVFVEENGQILLKRYKPGYIDL